MKFQVVPAPRLLLEAGYDVKIPEELLSLSPFNASADPKWIQKLIEFSNLIPREAVIDFSIASTVYQCIEKTEQYIKAGVKHFILVNAGPDPKRVMETYGKTIIPYFKEKL